MAFKDKARKKAWTKEYMAKYRKNPSNLARERSNTLVRKYGINLEQKTQMYVDQQGLCAICSINMQTVNKACLDHCHETNQVRGLLCDPCNKGIGCLQDSIEILDKAKAYLDQSKLKLVKGVVNE